MEQVRAENGLEWSGRASWRKGHLRVDGVEDGEALASTRQGGDRGKALLGGGKA